MFGQGHPLVQDPALLGLELGQPVDGLLRGCALFVGGARFPPTVWPEQKDIDAAKARWRELGLDKPKQG